MKKNTPNVRCVFTQADKNLQKLVEESFRLYLRRILAQEQENTPLSC